MDPMQEIKKKIQNITNKIMGAINPINRKDLPFIVFSLRTILRGLEKQMDEEQKEVEKGLHIFFGSEMTTYCLFKNGGGKINELQNMSILRCKFRP